MRRGHRQRRSGSPAGFPGIPDKSLSDGHQQEHGASAQRLLHLFRHHP
ncbi:hypothetical protein VQ300_003645 [Salmonella enterica]|nr:hypothetical protein [Salmonella enterica]